MHINFNILLTISLLVVILITVSCSQEKSDNEIIAKVGNSVLSKTQLERILPSAFTSIDSEKIYSIVKHWVKNELFYKEALNLGLDKDEQIKLNLDRYTKSIYSMAYLDLYLSEHVIITTEEIRDYYIKNRGSFTRKKDQVRLLHFLLGSMPKALEVKNKLLQYEGSLRQELISEHHAEIRTVSKGELIPELEMELFNTKRPRGIIGPIKSNSGYHIIQIIDWLPAKSIRGIDEVFEEISQQLFRQKVDDVTSMLVDSLSYVYGVNINLDLLHE